MNRSFVIKGNICHTPTPDRLEIREEGCVVCENGRSAGVFGRVPERFEGLDVIDASGKLVLPGMVDLHIHAPQYPLMGTGLDYELMEWLSRTTFPEESRYADPAYAARAYRIFAQHLRKGATTRAVIFGTIHPEASLRLMDLMEETGIVSLVGKVSMDRNAPEELTEPDAREALASERRFLGEAARRAYERTGTILTPRFVPACSEELLEGLGELQRQFRLPVQSHLSENPDEIALVAELVPEAAFYGDAYDRHGLFGREARTVMAHCVHSVPEEVERLRENGVWIAHCPGSNMNLASGIAPVSRYLDLGLRVGLGTDVSAGTSDSVFRAATDAIQVSKLYRRHVDRDARPLSFARSFYMATKGGGSFFGRAGSFEKDYSFDALVLDDSHVETPRPLSVAERLERAFYMGLDGSCLVRKFAAGREVSLACA